jgi:hypothetical protein
MSIIHSSLNVFKHGVIGAVASYISYSSTGIVNPICAISTSQLSDYICLRATAFFELDNLILLFNPIISTRSLIKDAVEPLIPAFSIFETKNCAILSHLIKTSTNLDKILNAYLPMSKICCTSSSYHTGPEIIAGAFAEELVIRVGIQKIALLSLAKLFPDRIGKLLSHQISRIMISSFIFAMVHVRSSGTLPQFLSGIVYGYIFEKYGFLTATITHCGHNILQDNLLKNHCEDTIDLYMLASNR